MGVGGGISFVLLIVLVISLFLSDILSECDEKRSSLLKDVLLLLQLLLMWRI